AADARVGGAAAHVDGVVDLAEVDRARYVGAEEVAHDHVAGCGSAVDPDRVVAEPVDDQAADRAAAGGDEQTAHGAARPRAVQLDDRPPSRDGERLRGGVEDDRIRDDRQLRGAQYAVPAPGRARRVIGVVGGDRRGGRG